MNRPARATDVVNFVMKNGDIRPLVVVRSWDTTPLPVTGAALPTVPIRAGEQVKFPGHNQPQLQPIACVNGVLIIDPNLDQVNVPIQAPVVAVVPAAGTPAAAPPSVPVSAAILSPSTATLEAEVAAGKASGASALTVSTGVAAQNELNRRAHLPAPGVAAQNELNLPARGAAPNPGGGIDFRNHGAIQPGTPASPLVPAATPGSLSLSTVEVSNLRADVANANAPGATAAQIQAGNDAAARLATANLSPTPAPLSPQPVLGGPPAPAAPGPVGAVTALPAVAGNAFSVWIAAAQYELGGKTPGTWHWPPGV
jgi:hypothetical protein